MSPPQADLGLDMTFRELLPRKEGHTVKKFVALFLVAGLLCVGLVSGCSSSTTKPASSTTPTTGK
jgi:hypothetical protein